MHHGQNRGSKKPKLGKNTQIQAKQKEIYTFYGNTGKEIYTVCGNIG